MKGNESVGVEWNFVEWNEMNRRNGEERGLKMTKNRCKL